MKNFFLSLLILSFINAAAAGPKDGGDEDYKQSDEATHIPAMVVAEEGELEETIELLEEYGVTVLYHRGNIILTLIPRAALLEARRAKGVKHLDYSKSRYNVPAMDRARQFNKAEYISSGEGLPRPYTGKDVVIGICDIGFDTRHPNFMDRWMTECRIRRVVHYEEQQGRRTEYSDPEEIYNWQTDNADNWHATHVAGIAGGAFAESDYYSLAPDADLVFTGSQLSDVGLLAGVEDIIAYAKEVGKPAVINLSVGDYLGPHDGTSLFTQYLDMCAEDAVICLSAGNEGSGGMSVSSSCTFSDTKKVFYSRLGDWAGFSYTGDAEIWSADERPFTFTFYWYNWDNKNANVDVWTSLKSEDREIVELRVSADPDDPDYDQKFADIYNTGYVRVKYGISPLNGRYYAAIDYSLNTEITANSGTWAKYWPGVKIQGDPGMHVDIFCEGGSFINWDRTEGNPDNSLCISNLATGLRTISVGMMNSRGDDSQAIGSGQATGEVNINSSYGTLVDGRKLPLTVAPGNSILSSVSSAYLSNHPEDNLNKRVIGFKVGDDTAYWGPDGGTSMATPFVASAIATWLEANPELTWTDVRKIIADTNQTEDIPSPDNPRNGQGWFNPYAGLLQAIAMKTPLGAGMTDGEKPNVNLIGGEIHLANPGNETLTVDIFNPAGTMVEKVEPEGTVSIVNLRHLPKGIYLVRISTSTRLITTLKLAI